MSARRGRPRTMNAVPELEPFAATKRIEKPKSRQIKPGMTMDEVIYGDLTGAVYVMSIGERGIVKIGRSKSPGRRVAGLQNGQDCKVCVFWAVRMTHAHSVKVESLVHKRLRKTDHHRSGEWYAIRPEIAVSIVLDEVKKAKIAVKTDLEFGYRGS